MKKTVICTGANGGIGRFYSKEMIKQGYHVILAVRNIESGKKVLSELLTEFPQGSGEVMIVDMGSIESIKNFANQVNSKFDRLDILAHNAGIYFFDKRRRTSTDGIELNFAIHVVGPYVLTAKLLDLLKNTSGSKVISMSSTEHHGNPIDLQNIQLENDFESFGNMKAYSRSKWATLGFTFALSKLIEENNIDMHALAAHPGVSITGIQHNGNPNKFQKAIIWTIGKLLAGKPKDAALPLAMASTVGKNGEFYGPTGFKEMKGKPDLVQPDKETKNTEKTTELWKYLESLTSTSYTF